MSAKVKAAIRKVRAAKRQLEKVVAETFPVGTTIHWEKGGHWQFGTVLHHGVSGNVRVENDRTGKTYWIGMYNVVGYVD